MKDLGGTGVIFFHGWMEAETYFYFPSPVLGKLSFKKTKH